MARRRILLALIAALSCACGGTVGTPTLEVSPTGPSAAPVTPLAMTAAPPSQVAVPAGRILAFRIGTDGLEHYFTVKTDGTDERALFSADGCGCARFSPDGTRIVTMGATDHGTWSLMTLRPDGSDRVVVDPPIETLTLAQPVSNNAFSRLAFSAWDDSDHSRDGLYIASPDLQDLKQVLPLDSGMIGMEPFGVTPDGSKVLFFMEMGPDEDFTHAGDLYVVESNGEGLRQLNPLNTSVGFMDVPTGALSPDGHQVAFAKGDDVWVGDVDGGPQPITSLQGFAWAVSWSPTGEWIAYTRQHGGTSVIALVRPDGSNPHEISAIDPTDEAAAPVWSPDGQHLLVRRGTDDVHDLWIMDLEGTFIAPITHQPGRYGNYSWAP